jgi:hypothetical protein
MPEIAAKPSKRATAAPKPKTKAKGAATQENVSKAPKKTGRPSKYTPELVAEICQRLSTGEPLRQICRDEHMPHWTRMYGWMSQDPDLSLQVARAREAGYDAMAEEALEIADTPRLGAKKVFSSGAEDGEDSMTVTEEDMLGHRKLQIETRLKLLACWNPKKYGNKVQHAGDADNPLRIEVQSEADTYLASILKNIELTKQVDANE